MNKVVKEQWLAALRSGKYAQGRGQLKEGWRADYQKPQPINKNTQAFCCLGVLCEVHRQMHLNVEWQPPKDQFTGERYFDEYEELPQEVAEWAELKKAVPVEVNGVTYPIYMLNDGWLEEGIAEHSFLEIAKIIEDQL